MLGVEKIFVSSLLGGKKTNFGELVLLKGKIYFKFDPSYLNEGFNLSPFKMPFSADVLSAETEPFENLYGVFNDSLPDGWGRLLVDRTLSGKGIDLSRITPLDRLSFVGSSGMGCLVYEPEVESERSLQTKLELDTLAREMNQIIQGTSTDILEELLLLGGSSGGARPKIFASYNDRSDDLIYGNREIPEAYEEWIIKFPSSMDNLEIGKIEYAYHEMAKRAGIDTSENRLFQGKSGRRYFGSKRFDRIKGKRLHVHTASGLMHDNFRMSTMDYGHLMDCAFQLEKHVKAYEKIFRLAAFNIYSHNLDDHSKNFSFLMDEQGEWRFAPAYDLTFSHSNYGFRSTMVAGESKNPGRKDLLKLATHFSMKSPNTIIDEVQESIKQWTVIAAECGVSQENIENIQHTLNGLVD